LLALTSELLVDVVLVTRGMAMYAASQIARRRADTPRPLRELIDSPQPERLEHVVAELAESARRRRLVLFVGAGVSMGAGAPSWQELLNDLATDAGLGDQLSSWSL
jgi:hypothetical protein